MSKNYQMYVGNGKLTKTKDFNECFVVKINNPSGASECCVDFLNQGEPNFPDCSNWEEEAFPLIFLRNEEFGDWTYIHNDRIATMKTAIKLFNKI